MSDAGFFTPASLPIPPPTGPPNNSAMRFRGNELERVIGTIRRECLDHVIVFNEASLHRHVKGMTYYHEFRTHLSLGKDAPQPRAVQPPELGRIVAIPQVGGLHQRYERRAA